MIEDDEWIMNGVTKGLKLGIDHRIDDRNADFLTEGFKLDLSLQDVLRIALIQHVGIVDQSADAQMTARFKQADHGFDLIQKGFRPIGIDHQPDFGILKHIVETGQGLESILTSGTIDDQRDIV